MKAIVIVALVALAAYASAQPVFLSSGLIASPYAAIAPNLVVPAVAPGYVAATRGSLHTAPLPGHFPYASHHINLAPAPGTI